MIRYLLALFFLALLAGCPSPAPIDPAPDHVLAPQGADGGAGGAAPEEDDPCLLDGPPGMLTRAIDVDLSACSGATASGCVGAALSGAIEAAGLSPQCWDSSLDHGVRVPATGVLRLGLQLARRKPWQLPTVWRARVAPVSVTVDPMDDFFVSPDCGEDPACYPRRVQVAEIVIGVGSGASARKVQAISFVDRGPL